MGDTARYWYDLEWLTRLGALSVNGFSVRDNMSDEDETADVSEGIGELEVYSEPSAADSDNEIDQPEVLSESNEIPVAENSMSDDDFASATDGVTQAEVYDNLKRIGELEDEKKRIQAEIEERTGQLRGVIEHIDRGSILYKMLESALKDFAPKAAGANSGKKGAKAAPQMAPKGPKKKSRRK